VAQPRFTMLLLSLFSGLALLLAVVGIYGVLSFAVNCRIQEIGVRMTLGARTSQVLSLVISEGMKTAALGVALGTAASLGLTRLLASQLHGVSAQDPATFLSVPLIFALVALAACCLPARRAASVDPHSALREE
ncbi:MAG: FtsX-like permease family protein, partial [Acidobacteriota bacterium]